MKMTGKYLLLVAGLMLFATGCGPSASLNTSKNMSDDLYTSHNRRAIAEAEATRELQLKALREEMALRDIDRAGKDGYYSESILSNSFDESYERRLRGFSSLSYKMPSSYYDFAYSDKAFQASAYDPAFYNVIVMGDEVWVEPRYVTAMFGNWGSSVNINLGWGWNSWYSPYWDWYGPGWYSWNRPYWGWSASWGWPYYGYGWHSPWYWDNYYWGWGGHHHHWSDWHGGRPDSAQGSRYGNRRPSMMGSSGNIGGGGSSMGTGSTGVRRNSSTNTDRIYYNNSGTSQGTTGYQRRGSSTTGTPSYNNNSTTPSRTPSYNGNTGNSNNSNSSGYQRRSSSPSYSAPSTPSSSGSYGGSSGGSSGGGRSSGGGSSSGGGGGGYGRR